MTTKERIIEQIGQLDESELLEIERDIRKRKEQTRIQRQIEALRNVAGMLSDPEEYAEFEKYARRRSLFGGRTLDLGADDES